MYQRDGILYNIYTNTPAIVNAKVRQRDLMRLVSTSMIHICQQPIIMQQSYAMDAATDELMYGPY
jgi:hypothetical protein